MNDRDAVEEPLLTLAQAWEALNGMRSEHAELVLSPSPKALPPKAGL
jgi:hypothetical protein